MEKSKLTKDEYKKFVMDIAVAISPTLIETTKDPSDVAGERIAHYARDIADAVEVLLQNGK